MTPSLPQTSLGEFLQPVKDVVEIQPDSEYKQVTVRLNHNGVLLRGKVQGETIGSKQYLAKEGQFIISKIDARNGAFGLIPPELDNAVVTGDFPLFKVDEQQVEPKFLDYYSATRNFVDDCLRASEGTTNRVRLKLDRFMDLKIPLPPIDEQRRIVARIEHLAAKVEEAKKLKEGIHSRLDSMITSIHLDGSGKKCIELSEILELHEQREVITAGSKYPQIGIRGFGGGIFSKEAVAAEDTSYKYFHKLYKGALVLSQVKGWEGAIAVCPTNFEDRFASPEYRTFKAKEGEGVPGYIDYVVRSKWFAGKLNNLRRGVGARRERTRPEKFLSMRVEMPDYEKQKQLLPIFEQAREASKNANGNIAQLEALLPSILDKAFKGEL